MKKYLQILFFLAIIPILLGMSSLNEPSSPDKIPIPEKKYKVTFIDQMDVVAECGSASIEGNTFIEGKIGNGSYSIPFDKMSNILFHLYGDRLVGVIKLTDGGTLELSLNKSSKAYGLTKYGTFQIKLIDLKKIILEGSGK